MSEPFDTLETHWATEQGDKWGDLLSLITFMFSIVALWAVVHPFWEREERTRLGKLGLWLSLVWRVPVGVGAAAAVLVSGSILGLEIAIFGGSRRLWGTYRRWAYTHNGGES